MPTDAPSLRDETPVFTSGQVATALGVSRRRVLQRLIHSLPTRCVVVDGKACDAWSFQALPDGIRQGLYQVAKNRGYQDPIEILKAPDVWKPRVAWCEASESAREKAIKLQRALAMPVEKMSDLSLTVAEFESLGVAEYRRAFGFEISARHWRRLFDRTVERDRGAGNFSRQELYLDERAVADRSETVSPGESELEAALNHVRDIANPTAGEKAYFWQRCFERFESLLAGGAERVKARSQILAFIAGRFPALGKNRAAIKKNFDRKFEAWSEDKSIEALIDNRSLGERGPLARRKPDYNRRDTDLVRYTAATETGGRKAQAFKELCERGLISDSELKSYAENRSSKSRLPKRLLKKLSDVEALRVIGLGNQAAKKMTPSLKLTREGLFAMDGLTADDKTLDVYVPIKRGDWYEMLRPQLLVCVDMKSLFVVSFVLIPNSQYTARDASHLYKIAFAKWGMPKFIAREGGLWRKSGLMNALAEVGRPFSGAETELRLRRMGVSCVDSDSGFKQIGIEFKEVFAARAKIVERVLGVLSNEFEKVPGYCGRNERIDCPEATKKALAQVRSKKADPLELGFLSWSHLVALVGRVIDRYNREPQEGYCLRNPVSDEPMSPIDAFEIYQNKTDPRPGFDSRCSVLLSHRRIEVTVKKPNLRAGNLPCGYVKIAGNVYCDEQTGRRIGRKLIAWYDPMMPETCTFTEPEDFMNNPFTVARLEAVNGWQMDETTEKSLAQARSAIAVEKSEFRVMQAKFEPLLRRNVVSQDTADLSEAVRSNADAVRTRRTEENQRERRAQTLARSVGMNLPKSAIERPGTAERLTELRELMKEEE